MTTKKQVTIKNIPEYLTYDDVLLLPDYSEITQADISLKTKLSDQITLDLPVVSAPMDKVCEDTMAIALGEVGALGLIHRNQPIERQAEQVRLAKSKISLVGASVGASQDVEERLKALIEAGAEVICIDNSHGHSKQIIELVKYIKANFAVDVIAGNVATYHGAVALYEAGADILRVGKGAGSICVTRVVTGIGVPQFTAVVECVRAADEYGKTIIADGGIKAGGDIIKALAAGSGAVMLGSMLAGTEEAPGEVIEKDGQKFKAYRGMGSVSAMKSGSADRYRQSVEPGKEKKLVAEGVEGMVPLKGTVKDYLEQIFGGVKSGMACVGSANLDELREKATFIRVTPAGNIESHPHDIYMKK